MIKSDAQQMKEYNRALVLRLIRREQPISRTKLAKMTGLSPTTVSIITDALISEGVVQERAFHPLPPAGAGRRPLLLEIRPEGGFLIAVDLGVTNTTVVFTTWLPKCGPGGPRRRREEEGQKPASIRSSGSFPRSWRRREWTKSERPA